MAKKRKLGFWFYLLCVISVAILMFIHLFNIYPLRIDRFTFYIVSIFVVLLVLPVVRFIKFFDIIHVGRDTKILGVKRRRK